MFTMLLAMLTPWPAPAQDACPAFYVSATASEKGKATFTAMLSGGNAKGQPTFNWSISAGRIAAGQGTVLISVEAKPGENVTATVDIGGYPAECPTSSSATMEISAIDASACPVFGINQLQGPDGAAIFAASAVPQPTGNIQIHWTVSSIATILSGQGTGSITVKAPAGQKFDTGYTLQGLPSVCKDVVSERVSID